MKIGIVFLIVVFVLMAMWPGLFATIPYVGGFLGKFALFIHDWVQDPGTWEGAKGLLVNSANTASGVNSWLTVLYQWVTSPFGLLVTAVLAFWLGRGWLGQNFNNFPGMIVKNWKPLSIIAITGVGGTFIYNAENKMVLLVIGVTFVVIALIIVFFSGKVGVFLHDVLGKIIKDGITYAAMTAFLTALIASTIGTVSPQTTQYAIAVTENSSYLGWWAGLTQLVSTAIAPLGVIGSATLTMAVALVILFYVSNNTKQEH